jgi:hypothetical protein
MSAFATTSQFGPHSRWIVESSTGFLRTATGANTSTALTAGQIFVDMGKTVYITRSVDNSSVILRKVKRMTPQAEGSNDYATGYICIGGDNASIAASAVSRLY